MRILLALLLGIVRLFIRLSSWPSWERKDGKLKVRSQRTGQQVKHAAALCEVTLSTFAIVKTLMGCALGWRRSKTSSGLRSGCVFDAPRLNLPDGGTRFRSIVGCVFVFSAILGASCILWSQYQQLGRFIFNETRSYCQFFTSGIFLFRPVLLDFAIFMESERRRPIPRVEPWLGRSHLLLIPTHAMTSRDTDSSRRRDDK